ncbi:MAG: acyltransferase [Armatimonadetes bacterium]|nr:acyltransferase [Armatimonadota bacterium]
MHSIEGMRGLAALYVVLGHFCTMADPLRKETGVWANLMRPFWYGHLAVAAFIVLSGFCLQMSLFKGDANGGLGDLRKFLIRRCRRILPPYYACLALSLVVCVFVTTKHTGMPWSQYVPVTRGALVSHLLMFHNLSPDWMYKINGVLWSIAIEFQLYLLFPTFVRGLTTRFGGILVTLVGLAVVYGVVANPILAKFYPWYGFLFLVGMVAARFAFGPRKELVSRPLVGTMTIAGLFGVSAALSASKVVMWADLAMGLVVAATLILISNPKSTVGKILGFRPLAFVGTFSYSLYLIHHPILQVITHNLLKRGYRGVSELLPLFLELGLPLILVLSYAFFWCFERPFIGKKANAP